MIRFAKSVTVNAEINGRKISLIGFISALVIFISLPTFSIQVKKFEKYIMPINPKSPVL